MQWEAVALMDREAHSALWLYSEQYNPAVVLDYIERRGFPAFFGQRFKHRINCIPQSERCLINLSQSKGLMANGVLAVGQAPHEPCFFKRAHQPEDGAFVQACTSGYLG
ncbi:hypothetical protein D3C79_879500 [compost metagenome]